MDKKVFKTLDEQINILKEKGLVIKDENYAKQVLYRENYFFLHGYRYPFLKSLDNKIYINGTEFNELYSLFLFDRSLRNIIFKNILLIENNTKSIISYQLSKKYGYRENEYLKYENFNTSSEKKKQIIDLLSKMKRQIKNNASNHSATMHYVTRYGYIPLWVSVKVLSFGIVAEFFNILKKEDQYEIVDNYDIDIDNYSDYLSILSNYRNLCAHEDILYDNKTNKIIMDTKYHRLLNIPLLNNDYIYGKNDLFVLIIIFKQLLTNEELKILILEIDKILDNLDYNLRTIPVNKVLDRMGFPENWKNILNVDQNKEF